jgi:putative sigma-54 modulation protein
MRLQVKGKNVELSPSIRQYAEAKLAKLNKQLAEETQVELELWEEKNPSIHNGHVAEATIFAKGPTLRAREEAPDYRAAIDQLVENLERQVQRYREKRRREPRRRADHHNVE